MGKILISPLDPFLIHGHVFRVIGHAGVSSPFFRLVTNKQNGVNIYLNHNVLSIHKDNELFTINTNNNNSYYTSVLIY